MEILINMLFNANNDALKIGLTISIFIVLIIFIVSRIVIKKKIAKIIEESNSSKKDETNEGDKNE